MTEPPTPPAEASEADWSEQRVTVSPTESDELSNVTGVSPIDVSEADEADLAEQGTVAWGAEDEER